MHAWGKTNNRLSPQNMCVSKPCCLQRLSADMGCDCIEELQILRNFLTFLIRDQKISCDDAKAKGYSTLQELFDQVSNLQIYTGLQADFGVQLPSWSYPDFIVLDDTVNDVKGKVDIVNANAELYPTASLHLNRYSTPMQGAWMQRQS